MTQHVLVTGGAGFIGSHLSRALLDQGRDVTVVDNLRTGEAENVPAGADFLELDLGRKEAIQALPSGEIDAVCHLAGQSSGEKSFYDPLYDLDANARSTLLLSRWALEEDIPDFLYASSMGVYGEVESHPVDESACPRPISYYGASKLAAEQALKRAAEDGLRVCSFRMFSVYGPGQDLSDLRQGMVSIYLDFLLREDTLVVKGPLSRVRDFIYIDDVVSAWTTALDGSAAGVFNLGTGVPTTVRELIDGLMDALGYEDHPVETAPGTPGDQTAISADIDRIRDALGWEPETPLDEGLRVMVDWARPGGG